MRLRSLLYVPAHAERFVAKAHERGADAIILDLEDSVPVGSKLAARDALSAAVRHVGQAGARVFVRINADADLRFDDAAAAVLAGVTGLMVPKLAAVEDLDRLVAHLVPFEGEQTPFIGLVEEPGAVLDARSLAAHPRVIGLALGGEDFATAMGAEPTPEVLRFPKQLVHMAAKASDKLSFGLLRSIADYADIDGIRVATAEAKAFGFDGATCVHPSAIAVLNAGFSPTEAELDWARRVIAEAEKAERKSHGAFVFEGKMVDAPVIARAHAILAKA
ncbi:CoA ester lyase [Aminobacter anthyllidis]|uniref:CoA ester lyase n=1 Tax=Aminobacter anthyllidis TaxID=1035067 RepID=A0A9X1ABY9_9HYPH|nr:CoA ester lyase [Aminobacter anthyllidis]MBT1156974.1 CoA ester lyase [Aminobacter anthyllidis]